MAKTVKTADQALANWKGAMAAPQTAQRYKDGINRTTVNPMAMAAAPDALQRYAHNTAAAAQPGGRMAQGLNRADPAAWKANAVNVGAQRLSSGATKGSAKAAAAFAKLAPVWQAQQAAVAGMAKGGLANAQARANAALAVMMNAFPKGG